MRRSHVVLATVLAGSSALGLLFAGRPKPLPGRLDSQQQIAHALSRLTWGIAPGDVARVQAMGLARWMQQQLHPEQIAENPVLQTKLAAFDTLAMSAPTMLEHYPMGEQIRAMAMGRLPLPADPQARMIAQTEIARYEQRIAAKQDNAAGDTGNKSGNEVGNTVTPDTTGAARKAPLQAQDDRVNKDPLHGSLAGVLDPEQIASLRQGNPEQRLQAFIALPEDTQNRALDRMPRPMLQAIFMVAPGELQRRIEVRLVPEQIPVTDLMQAKMLRAVYTNRQLEDVLTDFWFNHFNVFLDKGADRFLTTSFERDAIRPYVLGKFSDMLLATAKSPAMLFYLDNWQSADPNATARFAAERQRRMQMMQETGRSGGFGGGFHPFGVPRGGPASTGKPAKAAAKPAGRGLNENYGRELMELHTLGVDGGYAQADVIAVARCFTGWTIREVNRNPAFFYNDRIHDKGEKVVLGHTIPAGGDMSDGLKVLEILANQPATAHHISYELAQRFVADTPPESLVARMAATFQQSHGDLRQVMQTMLGSPEFWDETNYRAKVKSPLEMVVSAVRALGADVVNPMRLTQVVAEMGEPLYRMQPPTGYSNTGESWVSSSGLIARLNFALALTSNRVPGVKVDIARLAPGEADASAVLNTMFNDLLLNQVSEATRDTIVKNLRASGARTMETASGNPSPITPVQVQQVAGLILGSPEFQRR